MGYAQVWLAMRSSDGRLGEILERLQLTPTGEFQRQVGARWVLAKSQMGFDILIGSRTSGELVLDARLAAFSADREIIAGEAEEHVMVSGLSGWRDGQKLWSVRHDPEKGLQHLEIVGDPPAPLADIHARLIEEARRAGDDGVDYVFDVATQLSGALIGYKHDDGLDSDSDAPYEILQSLEPVRPFWKRLLRLA